MSKWYGWYLEFYSWFRRTKISRSYWKLAHRFIRKHQYNRLDTKLSPGYYDLDTQILYAVMNNLKEFYERETCHLNRNSDWDKIIADKDTDEMELQWFNDNYETKKELDIIYDWWVHRYCRILGDHERYWNNYTERQKDLKKRGERYSTELIVNENVDNHKFQLDMLMLEDKL